MYKLQTKKLINKSVSLFVALNSQQEKGAIYFDRKKSLIPLGSLKDQLQIPVKDIVMKMN